MAKQTKPKKAEPAPLRDPHAWERESIEAARTRYFKRRHRLEVSVDGNSVGAPHADRNGHTIQQLNTFGTTSPGFMKSEMNRLINAVCPEGLNEDRLEAALAVVDGIQPENEVEAMLACQMAATHVLTMTMMSRALRGNEVPQIEMNGSLAVKLSRTFTAQVEALAKLRRPPEQRVVVEHVHVHAGGQAVVGNVTHTPGGRATIENGQQPHEPTSDDARALAFAPGPPVWSEDAERQPVPSTGGHREGSLPDARRR